MDPASAIGIVASIATLSEGVAKALETLHNFRRGYKEASFTASLLIGQLSTIRAAVDQVNDWIRSSLYTTLRH